MTKQKRVYGGPDFRERNDLGEANDFRPLSICVGIEQTEGVYITEGSGKFRDPRRLN